MRCQLPCTAGVKLLPLCLYTLRSTFFHFLRLAVPSQTGRRAAQAAMLPSRCPPPPLSHTYVITPVWLARGAGVAHQCKQVTKKKHVSKSRGGQGLDSQTAMATLAAAAKRADGQKKGS